jgi:hypothetical protein
MCLIDEVSRSRNLLLDWVNLLFQSSMDCSKSEATHNVAGSQGYAYYWASLIVQSLVVQSNNRQLGWAYPLLRQLNGKAELILTGSACCGHGEECWILPACKVKWVNGWEKFRSYRLRRVLVLI